MFSTFPPRRLRSDLWAPQVEFLEGGMRKVGVPEDHDPPVGRSLAIGHKLAD
jgi:hypothetical protein